MHNYTATTTNAYQYKFQEQELQETGFYAFKWRQYMPDLGRFFNVDPLATKYPYNSTYAFSENCVVVHRELEGLEKVYIFGGADLDGKGLSQTTKNIQSSVQQFSDKNKLGFEVKTYNSAPWSPAHGKAFMDIMSNHTEGEKIIIYGYSLGGVGATQLTKMLDSKDIKVDLLVTVDPAFSLLGKDINIPDNVEKVDNTYQENRSLIGSRGFPATPIEGNDKTEIVNNNLTDKTSGKGTDAHGTIDEDTMKRSIQLIQQEMGKKDK
ncbi:hypothetical protein AB670_03921 [Chryseobacterium sp. MOF25P]|nr:hypothetical protein AB670_03921 [Chryseobacterium sp. MOF25P]OBW43934.1 hypothetical protein AB671_03974 [Chryseobacterium sp. BGARF1]